MRTLKDLPNLGQYMFLLMLGLITVAFFGMIKSFLLGVFWAAVLALLFYNWYEKLCNKLGGKRLIAAGLMTLLVLLGVVVPIVLIGIAVVNEALNIAQIVTAGEIDLREQIDKLISLVPTQVEAAIGYQAEELPDRLADMLRGSAQEIGNWILGFTGNLLEVLVQFTIMLYVLFFFFLDGKKLIKQIIWVLPFGDEKEKMLLARFQKVTRATVRGSLFIAIIQGLLGGLLFGILGIPGAVLWGAIMVVAALLPVGTALVWLPIAIISFVNGNYVDALIIVAVGSLFIGLIDNLLRPRLVSSDTKMPDYLILLSTLGGLAWFGISGFIIGPVIAALFISAWQIMGHEYGETETPEEIEL